MAKEIKYGTEARTALEAGAPYDLSSTTFLPFGPIVTLTVSASLLTPASSAFLASAPYLISFAISITPDS